MPNYTQETGCAYPVGTVYKTTYGGTFTIEPLKAPGISIPEGAHRVSGLVLGGTSWNYNTSIAEIISRPDETTESEEISMTDTNLTELPVGSKIKCNDVEYTVVSEADYIKRFGLLPYTATRDAVVLLAEGFLFADQIDEIVSVPEPPAPDECPYPVGTIYKTEKFGGRQYTIKPRTGNTPKGAHAVEGGGWNYNSTIGEIVWTPGAVKDEKPEPVKEGDEAAPEDSNHRAEIEFSYNVAAARLAALDGWPIEFEYKGEKDEYPRTRAVYPQEVVTKSTGTLIVAKDLDDDQIKSFRVDRIDGVIVLD